MLGESGRALLALWGDFHWQKCGFSSKATPPIPKGQSLSSCSDASSGSSMFSVPSVAGGVGQPGLIHRSRHRSSPRSIPFSSWRGCLYDHIRPICLANAPHSRGGGIGQANSPACVRRTPNTGYSSDATQNPPEILKRHAPIICRCTGRKKRCATRA
jgi:hypothetical protein